MLAPVGMGGEQFAKQPNQHQPEKSERHAAEPGQEAPSSSPEAVPASSRGDQRLGNMETVPEPVELTSATSQQSQTEQATSAPDGVPSFPDQAKTIFKAPQTLPPTDTIYKAPRALPPPEQPLVSDEQAKRERKRAQNRAAQQRYQQRLKERAAAGDVQAQEVLEKNRATRRETAKQWRKDNPERHRQHSRNWQKTERGKQYHRDLMRTKRERQKSENSQS